MGDRGTAWILIETGRRFKQPIHWLLHRRQLKESEVKKGNTLAGNPGRGGVGLGNLKPGNGLKIGGGKRWDTRDRWSFSNAT